MTEMWPRSESDGPLGELRVLDLSAQLPGPYATSLLADLGAVVVKVEPPEGDVAQRVDPMMYHRLNMQKHVTRLDLKSEDGRQHLHALARGAHVVVESWRPGVATRLAADPATLVALNPGLLYCSMTGFGQDGPLAHHPAHDLSIQAAAGAVPAECDSDRIGVAWVDLAAGQSAALTIAAHWQAGRTGYIDLAMFDIASAWTSVKPGSVTAHQPTYGLITTREGHRFAIAAVEDAVWVRLCGALGWADWQQDAALATNRGRMAAASAIRRRLVRAVAGLRSSELAALAVDADLPITAVDPPDPAVAEQLDVREAGGHLRDVPRPVPWTLVTSMQRSGRGRR